jgi:hypothetical protein
MTGITYRSSIETRIYTIRGKQVMLDRDLAMLYNVKPIALRQQVKRNSKRFPADFMFQLTKSEADSLVSQNVIPSQKSLGGYLPYAFTENGVAMLSSVLRSERAIEANIQIMRAFTNLRHLALNYGDLLQRIESMERKYDEQFKIVFDALRNLLHTEAKIQKKIGFKND